MTTPNMHDWSLLSITFNWKEGAVDLTFEGETGVVTVHAAGATDLHVPRTEPWGPSETVSRAIGPVAFAAGGRRLQIETHSGDIISVVANRFEFSV